MLHFAAFHLGLHTLPKRQYMYIGFQYTRVNNLYFNWQINFEQLSPDCQHCDVCTDVQKRANKYTSVTQMVNRFTPGTKVILKNSCSAQLLVKTKILKKKKTDFSIKISDVVFILLLNVKIPIVGA